MNYLIYKNYHGSIEYSKEDKVLFGKVLGIKSLISYEGKTGEKLEKDFQEAIDFYIMDCESEDVEPEVAFKGSFNVRVPSNVHMALALAAKANMSSLNSYGRGILEQNLEKNIVRYQMAIAPKGQVKEARHKLKTKKVPNKKKAKSILKTKKK